MKISVVIPTNRCPEKALAALALQTKPPHEVFLQREKGASNARNCGAEQTVGDVILFIDDDCILPPDFLQNLENNHTSTFRQFAKVVTFRIIGKGLAEQELSQDLGPERRFFTNGDIRFNPFRMAAQAMSIFRSRAGSKAPAPWGIGHFTCIAVTGEFWEEIGGFYNGRAEDLELFYETMKRFETVYYDGSMSVKHDTTLETREQVEKCQQGYAESCREFLQRHKSLYLTCVKYGFIAQLLMKLSVRFMKREDWRMTWAYLKSFCFQKLPDISK